MAESSNSHRTAIAIAVIGVVGTIGAALIGNWDKVFQGASNPVSRQAPSPSIQAELTTTIPKSYTLAGTWENDEGKLFASVQDSRNAELFELEEINPNKVTHSKWIAKLTGRDVVIDVYALPSGTHQLHMNLELSLDGNRMAGLSQVIVGFDEPPMPVHFTRKR